MQFFKKKPFAHRVGKPRACPGDKADVYLLCPVGSEPHDFEPKTSDMAKLSKADVFIYNGMGMESWAEKTVQSLKTDTLSVVEASKNIPYVTENEDAHVWLDPENAIYEMKNIKDAFASFMFLTVSCTRRKQRAERQLPRFLFQGNNLAHLT